MRVIADRVRFGAKTARVLSGLCALAVLATLVLIPGGGGGASGRSPARPRGRASSFQALEQLTSSSMQSGQPFSGVAAVGALFTETGGKLGQHFCTASVVHSQTGDLAVTAAHCVSGKPGTIAFVPGYVNGRAPYGVWTVSDVYMDEAWQSEQNPDHDVAFLRLAKRNGIPVEDVTGAEKLGLGQSTTGLVQVIGYPDGAQKPVWCAAPLKSLSPTQLQFDCGGYPTGTSGGPFLINVDPVSGQGTVIGVIGGYEQGGDTPEVSYAAAFGGAVDALYQQALAAG